MKVDSNWQGTTLSPETSEESQVLDTLWSMLPSDKKGYFNSNNEYNFMRKSEGDTSIFIHSGE